MDPSELSQFITILIIAAGALLAAPSLVFLFDRADRERAEKPRPERGARTEPTFQPA